MLHEDKFCDTLQAMAPTNVKTVHQTSSLHVIKRNLNRLGLLSPLPTAGALSNKAGKNHAPITFDQQSPSLHVVQKQGKLEYRGPW